MSRSHLTAAEERCSLRVTVESFIYQLYHITSRQATCRNVVGCWRTRTHAAKGRPRSRDAGAERVSLRCALCLPATTARLMTLLGWMARHLGWSGATVAPGRHSLVGYLALSRRPGFTGSLDS